MRRVLLLLLVVGAVFAAWPAVAGANSLDPRCNGDSCSSWFNTDVTLHWDISPVPDSATGCDDQSFSSEGDTSVQCDVTWSDGTGSQTTHVKIDKTPPRDVTVSSPAPGDDGWYRSPVDLTLTGVDDLSGIASCDSPSYSGPDGLHVPVGSCTDNAGNSTEAFIKYDSTPPVNDGGVPDRPPDHSTWYTHPVTFTFSGSDALSGLAECDAPVYSGPDGTGVRVSGSCRDLAGNATAAQSPTFDYDATPPTVAVVASRPPDHNGWYNHPVSFSASGTDAASGVASCSAPTNYTGPAGAHASVSGSCIDMAGNVGTATRSLQYDATPPARAAVQVVPGNHRMDISWTLPADAVSVVVLRSQQTGASAPQLVYAGRAGSFLDSGLKNGVKYRYTVTDIDQAGNASSQTVPAVPTASSLRPFVGSSVNAPPLLTWKKVKGARYYNVQLWRGKKKVLSKWPSGASMQVAARWHFRGHTYRLLPGHYRWYVWPGFGPKRAHRYGKLLGASSFRVR